MYICIDFDGTIVKHDYPNIGEPVPHAIEAIKWFQSNGHEIILFTMRGGKYLDDAVNYLEDNGIELFGVNTNPIQKTWTDSPKAYGEIYIDDSAVGCPLIYVENERPYVDWKGILRILIKK